MGQALHVFGEEMSSLADTIGPGPGSAYNLMEAFGRWKGQIPMGVETSLVEQGYARVFESTSEQVEGYLLLIPPHGISQVMDSLCSAKWASGAAVVGVVRGKVGVKSQVDRVSRSLHENESFLVRGVFSVWNNSTGKAALVLLVCGADTGIGEKLAKSVRVGA